MNITLPDGSVRSFEGPVTGTEVAADISNSLAKAALAVKNAQIPPSLGYEAPNPAIPFEGSPFRVNDTLTEWGGGVAYSDTLVEVEPA